MFDIYLLISSDSDSPEKKAIPANVLQPKYLNNWSERSACAVAYVVAIKLSIIFLPPPPRVI